MNSEIKLILLDFDGTLADTRRANALAYIATLAEVGVELSEEEYQSKYFGMRCEEFMLSLGLSDPTQREELRRRKIELYPSFFDSVRLNESLWSFCRSFREQGGRVWIVSTGSRANILNAMSYLGIALPCGQASNGGVDGLITGEDVTLCKPHPECFLEAIRREGLTPAQTLIFEDSPMGLEAAHRSGATCIKVTL